MRKLPTRCSTLFIASSLFLTACPGTETPTTPASPGTSSSGVNVRPIPSVAPPNITPTPAPSSVIVTPTPFPSGVAPTISPNNPSNPGTPDASVSPTGLTITTTTLPTSVINFAYNAPLQVVNGSGSYRWSIIDGNLPAGLAVDPNTGQVFGTPTTTGTFTFQVQVIDNQTQQVARQNLSLLVSSSSSGLNDLSILSSSLPSGTIDRRYSRILEVSGGAAPFSWSISSGSLPDGLSLNSSTGEISGTPTLRGEETFTVRVSDARGQSETRTLSITINRTDTDISILSPSLPVGVVGRTYNRTACGINFSGQLQATGGDGDYRWSISRGDLPAGLTLSSDGRISGTPTATGSTTFTARVQDNEDNSSSKVFTIETSTLAVHRFTPGAGGEDLRVVIFGENLNAAAGGNVFFGNVSSPVGAITNPVGCDQLVTSVPANAQTGALTIRNAGGTTLGSSVTPFISQNVVISEVFFNPSDDENQFVELKNNGSSSVEIANWQLVYTPSDSATAVAFTLPSETPALQPGEALSINLARDGATTADDVFTGSTGKEMRVDPLNATAADALTQIALCAGSCSTSPTDTSYRDYLQFGSTDVDGGALENNAVAVNLWSDNDTLNVTDLIDPLAAVTSNIADPNSAHYGVFETGNDKSGLLTTDGNKYTGYTGDVVVYYTPTTGAATTLPQRLRRTVTGKGTGANANRVRINTSLSNSSIQSTNTGSGAVDSGILVDSTGLLGPGDFVNVIAGGTLREVVAFKDGPRVELDQVLFASIQNGNTSDGTVSPGFTVGANEANIVQGANTVSITIRSGQPNEFTVTRNLVSTPAANQVVINEAVATAPVAESNSGDGTTGNEITLTSTTNFATGDVALFNGRNCDDGTANGALCTLTFGANQVRLDNPVATMNLSTGNTGDGSETNRLEVDDTDNFNVGDIVSVNGQTRTIVAITPAFGVGTKPRVELDTPLVMNLSNTTGDGTAGNPIEVASTEGFATGNQVSIRGVTRTITVVPGTPPRIELDSPIITRNIDGTNSGDGTAAAPFRLTDTSGLVVGDVIRFPGVNQVRTITAINNPTVTLDNPIVDSTQTTTVNLETAGDTVIEVVSVAGMSAGDFVKFSNNDIREIASVNAGGPSITLTAGISADLAAGATLNRLIDAGTVNLVPVAATSNVFLPVGQVANAAGAFEINLVPQSGNFTLVPQNALQDRISRIPSTGSIFLAPRSGFLRKYLSIMATGANNQSAGDYTITNAPTKGQ